MVDDKEVLALIRNYTFYVDGTFRGNSWDKLPDSEWKLVDDTFWVKHHGDQDFFEIKESEEITREISDMLRTEIVWKAIMEDGR